MKKIKIIFAGTPDMALVCLDELIKNNFDIVGVVPPKKDHGTYEFFKSFVKKRKLNFLEFINSPNEKEYTEKIKALNADIGVVCSYDIKLSPDFLKTTKTGYINSHPSLLPQYRGAMPYFHIINNNEKISGITLHFMDENFDTGDIIYQSKLKLTPFETIGTLFNKTNFMIADGLVKVLSDIQNGKEIKRIPQKNINADKLKKAFFKGGYFRINWNNNIDEIDSLIRACNPFFSAYCSFRGTELKIIRAHKIPIEHNFENGTIVKASKQELLTAASGGFISLDIIQCGSWGISAPEDFYNVFIPKVKESLK